MQAIIEAVIPLFAVVLIGYLAGRGQILSSEGIRDLTRFVFYFAIPPLLFRMMANALLTEIAAAQAFVFAYASAMIMVFVMVAGFAGLVLRRRYADGILHGMGAMFGNSVFITLPLVVGLYGERAALPVLLIVIMEGVIAFTIAIILIELGRGRDATSNLGAALLTTLQGIAKNPMIIAPMLGLGFNLMAVPIPLFADGVISLLGQAAAPCALFALGATLSHQRLAGEWNSISTIVMAKLILNPVITWLMLRAFQVEPSWQIVGILAAAAPGGNIVYLVSVRYGAAVAAISASVLLTTALSIIIITALLLTLPAAHF